MDSIAQSKGKRKVAKYFDKPIIDSGKKAKGENDYETGAKKDGERDEDAFRKALDEEHKEYIMQIVKEINNEVKQYLRKKKIPQNKIVEMRKDLQIDFEYLKTRDKVKWSKEKMGEKMRRYWDYSRLRTSYSKYFGFAPCMSLATKTVRKSDLNA